MILIFAGPNLPALASSVTAQQGLSNSPSMIWTLPFILLLLLVALLPQIPKLTHWWERNRNRLMISSLLAFVTVAYYLFRGYGFHGSAPGLPAATSLLQHAILKDYFPFIVLLFSLFTISGGIRLSGDIPAHPVTNTLFLLVGAVLANFIGTTGASMLLIRPLLQINSERRHVKHTVIFFIFLVSNIGGCLLPIGDPPLFLGYLRGVPFLWTLALFPQWITCVLILIALYWAIDHFAWRRETKGNILLEESVREPIRLAGNLNFLLLAILVLAVALLVPGQKLPGTELIVPDLYLREWIQLALTGLSLWITPRSIRAANRFNFHAINEIACIFIGIFVTVQVPIEILKINGAHLGLDTPLKYFWATGLFSSILDNAPTYIVFFETAGTLSSSGPMLGGLQTTSGMVSIPILAAISCGAVFMGAMTYIGNGPNFMVKSLAEQAGVKMPGFAGYVGYSLIILLPVFALISWIFFVDYRPF